MRWIEPRLNRIRAFVLRLILILKLSLAPLFSRAAVLASFSTPTLAAAPVTPIRAGEATSGHLRRSNAGSRAAVHGPQSNVAYEGLQRETLWVPITLIYFTEMLVA
jgi:hypothetical protein